MNTLTKKMFFKPEVYRKDVACLLRVYKLGSSSFSVRPHVGLIGPLISQVKHEQKFERTGEAAISKNVSQRRVFPWLCFKFSQPSTKLITVVKEITF